MADRIIRPATAEDLPGMAALKSEYVHRLYRCLLPDVLMAAADEKHYLPELRLCLASPGMRMDVLELDGNLTGFVVYGADPNEDGCGLIHETCVELSSELSERDALVVHTVEHLAEMGYLRIHMWLLRDNFRVRFLVEQFGFKPDGARRTVEREGQELVVTRYLYRAPGALPLDPA